MNKAPQGSGLFSSWPVLGLGIFLLAGSASCGQHPAESGQPAAAADEAAGMAQAEPVATEAEDTQSAQAAGTVEAGENEDVAAPPEEADTANTRLAQAIMPARADANSPWKHGQHYSVVTPAQPTAVAPGKVEVLEMFWYGCPHCYGLEPYLQSWDPKKASYIEFHRVPATWGPVHQLHARLFYTLMKLGRKDLHMVAFREVQIGGNPLIGEDIPKTEQVQLDFAKRHGISEKDFKEAYHSEEVADAIANADALLRRYKIDAVPHIVINGKYMSDVSSAGSQSRLIRLINDLAAREHNK